MIQKLISYVLVFNFVFLFPYIPNVEAKGAAKNAALVKIVKGKAFKIVDGKQSPIKKKEWLKEGTKVKTEAKSFVRLVYTDKSSMNVGPNSEMKIEQFDNKEPGMINVIKGKIRSKVSKDYLKIDKKRSKLLVRTPSAVMGVRGTEFVVSANRLKNGTSVSSVAVVEGNVMVANIDKKNLNKKFNSRFADKMINKKGLPTTAGKACVVQRNPKAKTQPKLKVVTMSAAQVESIAKNSVTEKAAIADESVSKKEAKKKMKKVKLPPGLTKDIVEAKDESSGGSSLEKSVGKTAGVATEKVKEAVEKKMQSAPVNEVKAADGTVHVAPPVALVDLDTGVILPPSKDATLDDMGRVVSDPAFVFTETGSAEIAGGIEINHETGMITKEVVDSSGEIKTVELGDMNTAPEEMDQVMNVVEQGVEQMTHEAGEPAPIEGPAPASIDGEVKLEDGTMPPPEGELAPPPEGELAPDGTTQLEPEPVNDFLNPEFTGGAGATQILQENSIENNFESTTTTTIDNNTTNTSGNTKVQINVK